MSEMAKSENDNGINGNGPDILAGSDELSVNVTRTREEIGSGLTQWGSRRVHGMETPSFTYFIRGAEGIKIGRSQSPTGRVIQLQGGSAVKLELLFQVPERRLSERAAHAKFKHLRMHGEWFRADQELLEFIDKLKAEVAPKPRRRRTLRPMPAKTAKTVAELLVLRRAHGFNSQAGRRCSNLAEILPIFEAATDPIQKATLAANIQRQMADLSRIRAGVSH